MLNDNVYLALSTHRYPQAFHGDLCNIRIVSFSIDKQRFCIADLVLNRIMV